MTRHALAFATVAALLATTACNKTGDGNGGKNAQTPAAAKLAGDKTISAGLPAGGKFMASAKAAGLDQTLAGPGPYTVLVPDDSAFTGDSFSTDPSNRAQLTGTITNLILPGTVLVADIDRAIDKNKGKDVIATMGGGTLTATKEGGKTVLTDSAGHKATITKADEIYSNGVVHHIDAVLMPSKQAAANAPAVGQKAGK
jgi:uncharacterized surface protein with fasciclin (FAS1) repeats